MSALFDRAPFSMTILIELLLLLGATFALATLGALFERVRRNRARKSAWRLRK